MNFIWIDDLPEREEAAKNLGKFLDINVIFIGVKGENLSEILTKMIGGSEPNLIIIDHNLEDSDSGIFKKGSSVAASIRESWPECPIVCVSAVDVVEVDSQQKALYEEIFSIENISTHYVEIFSIAKSYKDISEKRPFDIGGILSLIQVPEIDIKKVSAIFPNQNYQDPSLIVGISKWVRKVLIKRAGFLYDKLWLCTLIGIKVESFHKVEKLFEPAKYNGIFLNNEDLRWWKSSALEILYENSDISGLPWEKGRGLAGIEPRDYSVSYATEKYFPETVAYIDSGSNTQVPICIRESDIHPDYQSLLYFDDIRLMRPAE